MRDWDRCRGRRGLGRHSRLVFQLTQLIQILGQLGDTCLAIFFGTRLGHTVFYARRSTGRYATLAQGQLVGGWCGGLLLVAHFRLNLTGSLTLGLLRRGRCNGSSQVLAVSSKVRTLSLNGLTRLFWRQFL